MDLGTVLLQIFGQRNWIYRYLITLHYVLTNRYQTDFRVRHTEFGIPFMLSLPHSQHVAYEMISEKCKSKSYTASWENKFSAPNFAEMDSVEKVSPLQESHLALN